MLTPASAESYARELQRDLRAEATAEARARRLAPGPFDRLCTALRSRRVASAPVAPPAITLTSQPLGR